MLASICVSRSQKPRKQDSREFKRLFTGLGFGEMGFGETGFGEMGFKKVLKMS